MEDPRIEELMDYVEDVDEKGEPTSISLIARRVASYMDVVDDLRDDLDEHHQAVEDLEVRADNLKKSLGERESLRADITDMAQTAAMKASFSTTTGRGAALRQEAQEKRKDLKQFEEDYAQDEKRFRDLMKALEARQARLMEARDQIARRMNIIDALLQRAEIEWPSYFFEENKRLKAGASTGSSLRRRRGRGRGRTRIIRRRKAS